MCNGVEKIGAGAFSDCKSLKNLIIPDSVIEIGENAFKNVPHIEYNGSAEDLKDIWFIKHKWGAKKMN